MVMDKKLLLLLSMLCLAGCAGSDKPKTTKEPIFTEEANEPAAANVAATEVPNKKKYSIEYNGKQISAEEDADTVLQSLGDPKQQEEVESRAFVGTERVCEYDGLTVVTYPGDTKDYIEAFTVTSDKIATAEGIKIGTELSELKNVYGKELKEDKNNIYSYLIGNTELRFIVLDGRVAAINLYSAVKNKKLMKDKMEPIIGNPFETTVYTDQSLEQIDFLRYVCAEDEMDSCPTLVVDSSKVRIDAPGDYEVIFYAYDRAGNMSSRKTVYTVADKEAEYTEPEKVDKLADNVVGKIIKNGMTIPEKCSAIYKWIRDSFSYSESSDKLDWVQAAGRGLKRKSGDCFVYYSVAQELLYRSGVVSMRVQREEGYRSTHFWNLVYVPDQGWYHFDSTPRVGGGDDFNLVTDEWLKEYSDNHDNSHAFDGEKYPHTPNEEVKR